MGGRRGREEEEGEGGGGGGREREEVGERVHLPIWLQSAHGLLALDAGELSAGLKRDGSLGEEGKEEGGRKEERREREKEEVYRIK